MKKPDAVDVVSPEDWKQAREEMLVKEKEYMRAGDALAAERRRMPWLAVERDYDFVGPDGKMSFEDLFGGRGGGRRMVQQGDDLQVRLRLTLEEVTEGVEKPLKYPVMFRSVDLVVVNKIDLLPYLDLDLDQFYEHLRDVNPTASVIETSAKTGEGLDAWCTWLRDVLV